MKRNKITFLPAIIPPFNTPGPGSTLDKTPGEIIADILINVIVPFVAAVAVGAIIYGAILLITSQGDETKVKKAKSVLLYSVLGTLVMVLAYVIINMVTGSLGTILGP